MALPAFNSDFGEGAVGDTAKTDLCKLSRHLLKIAAHSCRQRNKVWEPRPWRSCPATGAAPRRRPPPPWAVRGAQRDLALAWGNRGDGRPGLPAGRGLGGDTQKGPRDASPPPIAELRRTPPGSRTPRPLSPPWPAKRARGVVASGRSSGGVGARGAAAVIQLPPFNAPRAVSSPSASSPRSSPSRELAGAQRPQEFEGSAGCKATPRPPEGGRMPGRGCTPLTTTPQRRWRLRPAWPRRPSPSRPAEAGPRRLPPRRIP